MSHQHQSWFAGRITRQGVTEALERDGDFLVRESENTPGAYVLSVR